jgi:hypothetical protein
LGDVVGVEPLDVVLEDFRVVVFELDRLLLACAGPFGLQCVLEEECVYENVLVYMEDLLWTDFDVDDFAVDTTEVSYM